MEQKYISEKHYRKSDQDVFTNLIIVQFCSFNFLVVK